MTRTFTVARATCAAVTLATLAPLATSAAGQTSTDRFDFHNDPKTALHHLLVDWALADAGEWPSYAPPIAERATWTVVLDDDQTETWTRAVAEYDVTRGRSLVFDGPMITLRDYATGHAPAPDHPVGRRVTDALDAALPVYTATWWPAHRLRGEAWIAQLVDVLDALEESIVERLETAYGGRWPERRVPIDVVPYANDVGAYSTAGRVTMASNDFGLVMPLALEMVFHESSHVDALEDPLQDAVADAFRRAGGTAPERLWHDLLFYTTGEVVRIVLEERGLPGYAHYGEATGVYTRNERWPPQLEAFDAHWKPFLRSDGGAAARAAALEAVARALLDAR